RAVSDGALMTERRSQTRPEDSSDASRRLAEVRGGNGQSDRPALPRTERTDAPLYLARYLERQAGQAAQDAAPPDDAAPLYLRRFRQRRAAPNLVDGPPPLPGGGNHRLVEVLRSKEIVAFPEDRLRLAATIR